MSDSPEDAQGHWQGSLPSGYSATREQIQREQILEAGAHLAQVLQAIWP